MHGIQHLFRQHALDKQTSTDSWHSAQSAVTNQAHIQQHYAQNGAHSLGSEGSTSVSNGENNGEFNQGEIKLKISLRKMSNQTLLPDEILNRLVSSPPQAVPDTNKLFHRAIPKRRSGHNGVTNAGHNNYVRKKLLN